MRFTNTVRLGLVVGTIVLLNACATGLGTSEKLDPDADVMTEREPSALPDGPVTPNPYLEQSGRVSAAAQREFDAALEALDAEDWAQAETLLLAMTERYPELSGPWVNLARAYIEQAREDEAVVALEQALQVNPKNLEAYNQLALLKREAGEFDRARELYQQALDVWPFHAASHRNLGILLDLYLGEGQLALLHYRAYQQLQNEPEREMSGWIMDLERQLNVQVSLGE